MSKFTPLALVSSKLGLTVRSLISLCIPLFWRLLNSLLTFSESSGLGSRFAAFNEIVEAGSPAMPPLSPSLLQLSGALSGTHEQFALFSLFLARFYSSFACIIHNVTPEMNWDVGKHPF